MYGIDGNMPKKSDKTGDTIGYRIETTKTFMFDPITKKYTNSELGSDFGAFKRRKENKVGTLEKA